MMMMMMMHTVAFHHVSTSIIPLRLHALRPAPRMHHRKNIAVTTHACSSSPSSSSLSQKKSSDMTSFATIRRLSLPLGYVLHDQSIGLIIRVRLDETNTGTPAATLTGVILPGARFHVESFRSAIPTTTTGLVENPSDNNKTLQSVTPGMCVFIAALALAAERRAKAVYGLAIDDAPEQHRRLVKYLARFGGSKVRRVDDSVKSVPDRMVYGGFGTIIRGDVESMLDRGRAMIERQSRSKKTIKKQ